MHNHGDYVTVYDRNGNLETRGHIVGVSQVVGGEMRYDVHPLRELSMSQRVCNIPANRIRKAYTVPGASEPKNVKDDA